MDMASNSSWSLCVISKRFMKIDDSVGMWLYAGRTFTMGLERFTSGQVPNFALCSEMYEAYVLAHFRSLKHMNRGFSLESRIVAEAPELILMKWNSILCVRILIGIGLRL